MTSVKVQHGNFLWEFRNSTCMDIWTPLKSISSDHVGLMMNKNLYDVCRLSCWILTVMGMLGIKQLLQINWDICPRQCYYRPKDFSVIYIIPPLTRSQILPWLRSKAQSQFFISEAFTTTFKLFHVSLVISHSIEKPSPLKSFIKMFSPPIFLEHDTEYPVLHSTMTEARVFFLSFYNSLTFPLLPGARREQDS